jgi:hypothetical protein
MIHIALVLIACVQEPDLSTPEKAAEAYRAFEAGIEKIEEGLLPAMEKAVLGEDAMRTPRLIARRLRESEKYGGTSGRFRPHEKRAGGTTVTEGEGGAKVVEIVEEIDYRWTEDGKEQSRSEKRPLRLTVKKVGAAWRVASAEERCFLCEGSGECGVCKEGEKECRNCQGSRACRSCDGKKWRPAAGMPAPTENLLVAEKAPAASTSLGTPKAAVQTYLDALVARELEMSRQRIGADEKRLAQMKGLFHAEAVAAAEAAHRKSIEAGRARHDTLKQTVATLEVTEGEAVAVVESPLLDSPTGASGKPVPARRRVVFKLQQGEWRVDRDESPCLACDATGTCPFCEGKGCSTKMCREGKCRSCEGTTWWRERWLGISERQLAALAKELTPLVEKATGSAMEKTPGLKISDAEAVAKILSGELEPQMKLQYPQGGKAQLRQIAEQTAGMLSRALLAKYEPESHTIHVLEGNFETLSKAANNPRMLEEEYLRVVVMHELVHASDQLQFKAVSNFAAVKTVDDLHVLNALVEGHAQYVTRGILAAEKKEELFRAFEKQITALPEGMSEGEKLLTRVMMSGMKFAYIDGQKFFEELGASGRKGFVAEVFAKPPSKRRTILHPKEYLDPSLAPVARDVKGLWKAMEEGLEEDWAATVQGFGATELEAGGTGFVERAASDEVTLAVVGGEAWVLQSKSAPGSKMVIVVAVQLESEAAARKAYDLVCAISKSKDAKLKEGQIRITSSEYGTVKSDLFDRVTTSSKRLAVGTEEIGLRDVVAQVGTFLLEVLHSNTGEEAKVLEEQAVKAAAWLRGK